MAANERLGVSTTETFKEIEKSSIDLARVMEDTIGGFIDSFVDAMFDAERTLARPSRA